MMRGVDQQMDVRHFHGTPLSMLSPLFARANIMSVAPGFAQNDATAKTLLRQIRYNEAKLPTDYNTVVGTIVRSRRFDAQLRKFVARNPKTLAVELGCGLDTRYERVAVPDGAWLTVDLPEVHALREELLPDSPEIRVSCDLRQGHDTWLDAVIGAGEFDAVYLMAEGLLYYLDESTVHRLVESVQQKFANSGKVVQLHFDYYHPYFTKAGKQRAVEKLGTRFTWGVRHPKEVCPHVPQFKLIGHEFLETELPLRSCLFSAKFALKSFGQRAYGLATCSWDTNSPK